MRSPRAARRALTSGTTWHAQSRGHPLAPRSADPRSRRSTSPYPVGLRGGRGGRRFWLPHVKPCPPGQGTSPRLGSGAPRRASLMGRGLAEVPDPPPPFSLDFTGALVSQRWIGLMALGPCPHRGGHSWVGWSALFPEGGVRGGGGKPQPWHTQPSWSFGGQEYPPGTSTQVPCPAGGGGRRVPPADPSGVCPWTPRGLPGVRLQAPTVPPLANPPPPPSAPRQGPASLCCPGPSQLRLTQPQAPAPERPQRREQV